MANDTKCHELYGPLVTESYDAREREAFSYSWPPGLSFKTCRPKSVD